MSLRPRPITMPVPATNLPATNLPEPNTPAAAGTGHRLRLHPVAGGAGPGSRGPQPVSLADITERLFARFDGRFGPTVIARVVRQCHRELEIAHGPVPPEALEYLAHERLGHLAEPRPR